MSATADSSPVFRCLRPTAPPMDAGDRGAHRAARRALGAHRDSSTAGGSTRRPKAARADPPTRVRPPSRSHAVSKRSAGLSVPISARSRRHNSACQRLASDSAAPDAVTSSPHAHARTICGSVHGVAVEQVGHVTGGAEPPQPPNLIGRAVGPTPRWPFTAATTTRRCSRSRTSSSGHTARSGRHGSLSRSIPHAAPIASPTSRPGNGKSRLAHTPSAAPAATARARAGARAAVSATVPPHGWAPTPPPPATDPGAARSTTPPARRRGRRPVRSDAGTTPPPILMARPCRIQPSYAPPCDDAAVARTRRSGRQRWWGG